MKLFMMAIFLFSTNLFAQEITKIEADYRCEQLGGGVAIKIGTNETARVWQTDLGEEEGLELQVTSFSLARCPGCFSFNAVLMGMVEVRGHVSSSFSSETRTFDSFLTYEMFDQDLQKWVPVLNNIQCANLSN